MESYNTITSRKRVLRHILAQECTKRLPPMLRHQIQPLPPFLSQQLFQTLEMSIVYSLRTAFEPALEEIVPEALRDLPHPEGIAGEEREGVEEVAVAHDRDERCTHATVPLSRVEAAIQYDLHFANILSNPFLLSLHLKASNSISQISPERNSTHKVHRSKMGEQN